jgi:Prokaryotic E2 family E
MSVISILPEDDQTYLLLRAVKYRLLEENVGGQLRRGVEFLDFDVPANLYQREGGILVAGGTVSVLVLIPPGYPKARLDSWYVRPGLFLANGCVADRAGSESDLFNLRWQFWSRHLQEGEWRPDIDGLETYVQYVRAGLRNP